MFGDKNAVVDSFMIPNSKAHEKHVALSFHRVRESIAVKIVNYLFVDRKNNPDDVLTKHWDHHDIWYTLKPILFWPRDAMECLNNNSLSFEDGD